jgi:hypothetical protein
MLFPRKNLFPASNQRTAGTETSTGVDWFLKLQESASMVGK